MSLENTQPVASLCNELTRVKKWDELFSALSNHLTSSLNFNDLVILTFDSLESSYSYRMFDRFNDNQKENFYSQINHTWEKNIPLEIAYVNKSESNFYKAEIDHFLERFPSPEFQSHLQKKKSLSTYCLNLSWHKSQVGYLIFLYKEIPKFTSGKFILDENLRHHLSTVISALEISDKLKQKEDDNSILLEIAEKLTLAQTCDGLVNVIKKRLRPIFFFDDSVIFMINQENHSLKVIANLASKERSRHAKFNHILSKTLPLNEWILKDFHESKLEIISYRVADILKKYPDDEGLKFKKETGIKYCILRKLICCGVIVGYWYLLFETDVIPSGYKHSLEAGISNLLAIAVENISSREETLYQKKAIEQQETEKTVLLNISNYIASIRVIPDLLQLIVNNILPIYPFDDYVILLLDEEHLTFREISEHTYGDFRNKNLSPTRNLGRNSGVVYKDSLFAHSIGMMEEIGTPMILNLHGDYAHFSDLKNIRHFKDAGMVEAMTTLLKNGDKTYGTIALISKKKGHFKSDYFKIFQAIAHQITLAVVNILANEEIAIREKENVQLLKKIQYNEHLKSIQLSINNSLLKGKDFKKMVEKLANELGKSFSINFLGFKLFKGGILKESISFLRDADNLFKYFEFPFSLEELDKCYDRDFNDGPVVFSGETYDAIAKEHAIMGSFKKTIGSTSVIFAPLKTRGNDNAFLILSSTKNDAFGFEDFALLEVLLPQISIVFENFMAFADNEDLKKQLEVENVYLREEVNKQYNFKEIIGSTQVLYDILDKVNAVAVTDSTVLIEGETGTGKELFARAIHNLSLRRNKPLIKINCAALPPHLIESELFGHERGAFTGAIDRRIGKFEIADKGTLFLDEIGELPLELQSKLLRVIQEKELERLGSNKIIKIDVRIIAATNRNLREDVKAGKFRMDLFYRLNVFPITLPPLRDRKEDIPLLASYFISKIGKKLGKTFKGISKKALSYIQSYDWPGNIRELEYLIERSAILTNTAIIHEIVLPVTDIQNPESNFIIQTSEECERQHIIKVLKYANGKISGKGAAADLLGLPPTTLQSKMIKLGIKREHVLITV